MKTGQEKQVMPKNEKATALSVKKVLIESAFYCRDNWLMMLMFAAVNYMLLVAGFALWSTVLFLPLAVVAYLFWSYFFRFYFQKTPYLQLKPLLNSLMPSSKILIIGVMVTILVSMLPFVPLLLVYFGVEVDVGSLVRLQRGLIESRLANLAFILFVTLLFPQILFRPFMAWISALLGRNRTLRYAWSKTKGNYLPLLCLAVVMNLCGFWVDSLGQINDFCMVFSWFLMSPLMVYFNVVIAQVYAFFFED